MRRGLAFYRSLGIDPRRIQTDNHSSYTKNRSLAELLTTEHISHHTIRPRTPRHNGSGALQQTLKCEWAVGQRYRHQPTAPKHCHTG